MKKSLKSIDLHVSAKLKEQRLLAGFTQQNLAKHLGVTFQQIQKYENGGNRLSSGRLFLVSKLFNVDPAIFFEGLEVGKDASIKNGLTPQDIKITSKAIKLQNKLFKLESETVRDKMIALIKALSEKDQ